MGKIYILEDDKNISEIEQFALKNAGYEVSAFATASDFENALTKEHPDLIIMDIMLPDRDGLSVLKDVRAEQSTAKLPVIMVTAKTSEMDKVKGLDQGADDYMTKPFGIMELISRVKALLRRAKCFRWKSRIYSFDGITMDDAKHQVLVDGQETELTYKEYQLLKMLIQNSGIVLQRSQILDRVWGIDYEGESRTLDMHIKTLRRKIGEKGNLIQTVRNVGYTMNYRKDK
ncbi:MAG: response regulator transcription factor [Eubacterium ventriosum]